MPKRASVLQASCRWPASCPCAGLCGSIGALAGGRQQRFGSRLMCFEDSVLRFLSPRATGPEPKTKNTHNKHYTKGD